MTHSQAPYCCERGGRRERCSRMLYRVHRLAMIVGHPLRIVSEFGEAPFEPLKFLHLVGTVRYLAHSLAWARYRLAVNIGKPFCENKLTKLQPVTRLSSEKTMTPTINSRSDGRVESVQNCSPGTGTQG